MLFSGTMHLCSPAPTSHTLLSADIEPSECRNCGAFLKITARAPALVNAEIEAIDSARIEPLSYKVAFEVARTAVGGDNRSREDELANINRAMEYPEKVEATNLEVADRA